MERQWCLTIPPRAKHSGRRGMRCLIAGRMRDSGRLRGGTGKLFSLRPSDHRADAAMVEDGPDRVPEEDAVENREAGEDRVRGSAASPDGSDADSISVGHEVVEGSGLSDSSSEIRIGTGRSGVVSDEWSLPGELRDASEDDEADNTDHDLDEGQHEPPSVGSFELPDGLVADLEPDFGSVDVSAADDQGAGGDDGEDLGSEFSEFADIDNPEMAADLIGETSQDELPGSWDDSDDGADSGDAVGGDPVQTFDGPLGGVGRRPEAGRSGLRPRPVRRKQSAGSVIGVIVGGLLALPIVLVILLWGFRRDDFGIARALPEPLVFLVPAELRVPRLPLGSEGPPMPRLPRDGFMGDTPDVMGETADVAVAGVDPPVTSDAGTTPAAGALLPEDPLLDAADVALLEMATARAGVMLTAVIDVPDDAPDEMRKRALVEWYKSLAAVGEQAAEAEQVITDAGRSAAAVTRPLVTMVQQIVERPGVAEELATLAEQWMQATKRDAEGVVFPGTLLDVRRVGGVWVSTVRAGDAGTSPLTVTAMSRQRPATPEGSEVVAFGVVVADEVIWAASWVASEPEVDTGGDAAAENEPSPLTGE